MFWLGRKERRLQCQEPKCYCQGNLDGGADEYEEEVGGGEAGEEGVGRRLEGALLHHHQDDQQVAQHSKCKDHPVKVRFNLVSVEF